MEIWLHHDRKPAGSNLHHHTPLTEPLEESRRKHDNLKRRKTGNQRECISFCSTEAAWSESSDARILLILRIRTDLDALGIHISCKRKRLLRRLCGRCCRTAVLGHHNRAYRLRASCRQSRSEAHDNRCPDIHRHRYGACRNRARRRSRCRRCALLPRDGIRSYLSDDAPSDP